MEWFVDAIETGAIKIPEIQKQYAKIKDDLEVIDYKKTIAKYQLDDMNNQITYLNKISYNKRNEIAYLKGMFMDFRIITNNNNIKFKMNK